MGYPPIQLQVIENDRMEIKSVWMGLTLLYEDRRETLPVIQSTAGLEYDLASALKKLINVNKRIAGIVIDEAYQGRNQRLNDLLGQTYDMTRVDLAAPVPPNLDLLIMNGVTDSIGITKLYNLDQYLMSGRPLFIAQSSVEANLQQSSARLFSSDLLDALEHYGLEVLPGLVADRVASQVAVETQRGIFRMRNAVEYPFFPLIRTFNKDHLITSGLEQVRVFFTSPLSAVPDSLGQGAQFMPLMHTSDFTNYVQGPNFNISHVNNPNFVILNGPGLPVAGLLSGSASSTFTEENRPEQADLFISSTPKLQILVVGDREFFIDEAGGGIPENQNFVINAADYLVGDEDLIAVRSRQVSTRPLKVLSNGVRRTYRWINILGPSAMVAGLGLWRWRGSRTRRKFLEEVYGS